MFLAAVQGTRNVSAAARAAGVGRRTVYDHLAADEQFAAAMQNARASSAGESPALTLNA